MRRLVVTVADRVSLIQFSCGLLMAILSADGHLRDFHAFDALTLIHGPLRDHMNKAAS